MLWRKRVSGEVEILMGQRHARHAFMANAFVFPGGRVDPRDARAKAETPLRPDVAARLERASTPARARALAVAAVRETFEETGLLLAEGEPKAGEWHARMRPYLGDLDYFFRAITPPGRNRRFDARFFLTEAAGDHVELAGDGELIHLDFRTLDEIRGLQVSGITRIVLAEAARVLADPPPPDPMRPVPLSRFVRGQYVISPG